MHQYGLAIHTSSSSLGLCLGDFVNPSRVEITSLDREISTHLHQHLLDFLAPQTWSDLDFLAVAKGPGSFAGTRIGVVTARTLAQQLNIPVWGISTLAGVVWSQRNKYNNGSLIPVEMEARRGQLFAAIYQLQESGLHNYLPETSIQQEVWQQTLAKIKNASLPIKVSSQTGETVASILELAYLEWQQGKKSHWREVLPFYGQHPIK